MRLEGRVEQALDIRRQRAVGFKKYIWRSQDDARVRLSHAMNDDRVFEYDKSPAVTGPPGDDFGCRCRAEILAEGRGEPEVEIAFASPFRINDINDLRISGERDK